jgi:hypothetical protein
VTQPFDEDDSWQSYDASATDGLHSVGYNGGAFDGRYFYAAPWQQGPKVHKEGEFVTHGIVLRCDTLGDESAFSLRWCDLGHNGGLNAGVIGPSFLINTQGTCLRVSDSRLLSPGLHHLAGTYDGQVVRLFVDGDLVAEQQHVGTIPTSELPVAVGHIQDGAGALRGEVIESQIQAKAASVSEIADTFAQGLPRLT